jgi:hypothetical protein
VQIVVVLGAPYQKVLFPGMLGLWLAASEPGLTGGCWTL